MKTPILISAVLIFTNSHTAFAWGNRGHELIADTAAAIVPQEVFQNCHVSAAQISEHSTDPDLKWRRDRRRHPNEAEAHFFHVDKQPNDWKTRSEPEDPKQGYLVYRIVNWTNKAIEQRKSQKWGELSETLYGLVHYLGDLSMPLHLNSKHDGEEVGLPDLHSQWESKMVSKYEKDLRAMVEKRLRAEKIPAVWKSMDLRTLITNVAVQSHAKSDKLFELSREAVSTPNVSSRSRRKKSSSAPTRQQLRFSKPKLFKATGEMAADQLALSARLWAHVLTKICQ